MKKIFLFLLLAAFISSSGFAQCGKKITYTAAKAEFVDESGNVQDTKNVQVQIKTSGQRISIMHSDDESDTLAGPVKEVKCNWKTDYKDGKTVFTVDLSEKNGDYSSSTIVIEGKDSKLLITITIKGNDGSVKSIRIPVDSFKEG
jgi:hypothetical protein